MLENKCLAFLHVDFLTSPLTSKVPTLRQIAKLLTKSRLNSLYPLRKYYFRWVGHFLNVFKKSFFRQLSENTRRSRKNRYEVFLEALIPGKVRAHDDELKNPSPFIPKKAFIIQNQIRKKYLFKSCCEKNAKKCCVSNNFTFVIIFGLNTSFLLGLHTASLLGEISKRDHSGLKIHWMFLLRPQAVYGCSSVSSIHKLLWVWL